MDGEEERRARGLRMLAERAARLQAAGSAQAMIAGAQRRQVTGGGAKFVQLMNEFYPRPMYSDEVGDFGEISSTIPGSPPASPRTPTPSAPSLGGAPASNHSSSRTRTTNAPSLGGAPALLRFGLVLALGAAWFVALVAYSRWLASGEGGTTTLFLPSSLADAKRLHAALAQILAENSDRGAHALCLFALTYLWKQSFAVPGSAVLNVLAGSLFGLWRALLLTSILTAAGATVCFSLSKAVGSDAIAGAFPRAWARVEALRAEVDGERARGGGALFAWLIAARLFPFTPNWLLNMSFPHLGVQPAPFFLSVLLGLSVYNYITCSAGAMLFSLTSMSDITDTRSVLAMLGLFAVVVGFAMWSRRVARARQQQQEAKQAGAQKKNI